jgi:hypothetical protein
MSAMVFSHYYLTGNEGADFQVGDRPVLDEYDGFFDQTLDAVEPGAELFLLLSDRSQLPSIGSNRASREMRDRLDRTPLITGKLVENAGARFVFEVHKRETFLEVVRRKPLPVSNEAVTEVARYKKFWEHTADHRRTMGSDYRFKFVCGLPSVSSVEQALHSGFHYTPQTDFGPESPRVANRFALFLEPGVGTSGVRVIALGDNDINSSRVFDLTDVSEYRACIRGALAGAELREEANCWNYLLK